MTDIRQVSDSTTAVAQVNTNFKAVSAAGMYGYNAFTTTGLFFGYYGGRGFGNTIADSAVLLTASSTNYIVANRSTGAVTAATNTTNWNDSTNYYRCHQVVTGTASITSFVDYREFVGGSAAGGGMTNPMTTAGDIIYGGASGTPTRLAASTNGFVLTLAAGVPTWSASAGGGFSNPMTTVGDLIVGGTSGAAGRLAASTSGYVLTSNGAGVAPTWQAAAGGGFTGGTLTTALNEAPTVTVASSATPAIGAAAGNSISLTGTTTVTGFDTIAAGAFRRVVFAGILTLTHNATSLILPTAANITTAAGDVAEFLSLGAGNWRCLSYSRASGAPLTGGGGASAMTVSPQSVAYTMVLGDANSTIYHPASDITARVWTIPANASVAYPVGTMLTFDNDFGAGALTIAINTDTLVLVGAAGTTGSRTLNSGGQATAVKVTATRWRISGVGIS